MNLGKHYKILKSLATFAFSCRGPSNLHCGLNLFCVAPRIKPERFDFLEKLGCWQCPRDSLSLIIEGYAELSAFPIIRT